MSQIAMEAALAELAAWRRETERKLARLEAEVSQLKTNGALQALHTGPPTLDLSAITAVAVTPYAPQAAPPAAPPQPIKEPTPPWAVPAPAVAAPVAHAPPLPAPHPPAVAHPPPHASPAPVAAAPQPVPQPAPPVAAPTPAAAPPAVVSIQPRVPEVRHQYKLELEPGETFDMPSGLDGGRRKRVLSSLVVMLIVSGMAALIISALASQR
jgi:hypothetical protein